MSLPKALLDQGLTVSHTRNTVLSDSMPAGTLIYNLDPVNAIWVSASSGVSPGNGTQVGPLGSISWTEEDVRVWACVDSGVLTDVPITLSSSLTNPQNPVAVAEAIASVGIPSVYVDELIGTFILAPAGGSLLHKDVHKFASLEVFVDVSLQRLLWIFEDETQTIDTFEDIWTNPASSQSLVLQYIGRINVKGFFLSVINDDPFQTAHVTLVGTNRQQSRDVDTSIGDGIPMIFVLGTQAWVNGQTVGLPGNGATKIEGPVYAEFVVSGNVVKGVFRISYTDAQGVAQLMTLMDTSQMVVDSGGNQHSNVMISLPRCGYEIDFTARTAGNASVNAKFLSAR